MRNKTALDLAPRPGAALGSSVLLGAALLGLAPEASAAPGERARRAAARPAAPRAAPRVLERAVGRFGAIFVVVDEGQRRLRFGSPTAVDQSAFDPAAPRTEPLAYVRLMLHGLAFAPAPRRVLLIGLGGGSLLGHLRRLAPRAELHAVEIDPVVVRLAKRWMGLGRAGRVRVHIADGRRFLARDPSRWDLILLDAYDNTDYPAHLGTLEFFTLARSRLAKGGALVANLSPDAQGHQADLLATFARALPGTLCRTSSPDSNAIAFGGDAVRARPESLSSHRFARLVRLHGGPRGLLSGDGGPCDLPLGRARILRDPPGKDSRGARPDQGRPGPVVAPRDRAPRSPALRR